MIRPLGALQRVLTAAATTLAMTAAVSISLAVTVTSPANAAATPQPGPLTAPVMGWNSWNRFGCNIDENLIKATADAMVSTGLRDSGYTYVDIDDCWMAATRDSQGRLQPDPVRFPGGIAAIATYVHARGLKLGIYSSAGTATCQGLPASLDHEVTDAQTWASWGVDLLKYDNCNNQGRPALERYKAMGDALKATGRQIVYSLCNWGNDEPWIFGPNVGGSSWRTTDDINASWGSITSILDQQAGLEPFARKGFYNDPDMLEVGNGSLTQDENIAHFSLWALLSAPLLLGNDLRSVSSATLNILRNPDVIAVNRDWAGSQGRRVADTGDQEVWAKPMSDGSVAVALFNRGGGTATVATTAAALGLGGSSSYSTKNLWTGATATTTGALSASVPSHGVAMYRVTRAGTLSAAPAAGTYQVSDLSWVASSNGWGPVERDRANGEQAAGDGATLNIGGTTFTKGLGTHADSAVHVYLGRACRTFTAQVGVDNEVGANGSVRFQLYGDGKLLAYTGVKTGGQPPTRISASVGGYQNLELRVTDARNNGINYDHADWGSPTLVCGTPGTGSAASDRPWGTATNAWGPAERDMSNGEQAAADGSVITVSGISYPKGVGAHAAADITIPSAGCTRFTAVAGLDAEVAANGTGVTFSVLGDATTLYTSPTVAPGSSILLDVDITGRANIHLVVGSAGSIDYDHADWADARLLC
ncbi:NPCBM/NEW2 domain-containing protein [Dactylosporangium matsuzakiense]|uniref:Alpha-galactosidase n=1 Tax=Dactylosporangium matsuzakiense TaxID=53360 RepID=A0A9W6KL60_9ACTN|nr:NPCBM/NEW2 domain-containing protein [Dactylosporangium matsuzakiense]UWZ43560.1 NPCBM/NEW2 domain-containing protein [Dactylosporangium matsuzakiense]GLL04112.1 alpha-galactosidase [Dactylosporangium matsuzakiense]